MVSKIEDFPLILLTGGQSSRMGEPKGLVDFRGRAWLLEQLSRFKTAGGNRAVLALGYQVEAYFEKIPWLPDTRKRPARRLGLEISTVINPHPEKGQFSSLLAAFASPLILGGTRGLCPARRCPRSGPEGLRHPARGRCRSGIGGHTALSIPGRASGPACGPVYGCLVQDFSRGR